jgi:uroporphyrinogen-III decarboxylase
MTDIAKGLPKGRVILDLEKTDIAKAKEILGDKVCLYGNVPSSLLVHGTVNDVKKYCKKLIEDCAEGGGFILSTECETPWDAKPENVRAIIDSAKEYGKYK